MKPVDTTKTSPGDTRDRILDAAERLFVERGYAATSMRAIAGQAGVNLAAANYHFGSKMGLVSAVFHRRVAPITAQRLAALQRLQAQSGEPTVREIMEAFFEPFASPENSTLLPAVVGWFYGESEGFIKPILEREFAATTGSFQEALAPRLPQLDAEELGWRMHFIIGSMLHLIRINAPLGMVSSRETFDTGLQRLVDFSVAALTLEPGRSPDA